MNKIEKEFDKFCCSKLIEEAVQEERERIVKEIEGVLQERPEKETLTYDIFKNTENMNRVFMRVGIQKGLKHIINLINQNNEEGLKCPPDSPIGINIMEKEKKENLIVCYGSENITLNKGENHIILNKEEVSYLLQSLLNNMEIRIIKVD